MLSPKSVVPFHVPLPVGKKTLPLESAANPPPLIHTPLKLPLGDVLKTASCKRVLALYEITQPCQGLLSQCEDQPMITCPLSSSSAAR